MPRDIVRIAVVRIESGPSFSSHHNDSAIVHGVARQLIRTANRPGIAVQQIDFYARRSERDFDRRLLEEVRRSMPAGLPLDMTALVSWCAEHDWIPDLPVNSAIPMFLRMEPGRARLSRITRLSAAPPEPLCNRSVGVSTHEPWPADSADRRMYIFADHGWKSDLPLLVATEQNP